MTSFIENKQLIHVATEIVVGLSVTFYFNQQNKKLKSYIDDLFQRIEQQEEEIQKHTEIIEKLLKVINENQMNLPQTKPRDKIIKTKTFKKPTKEKPIKEKPIKIKEKPIIIKHNNSPYLETKETKNQEIRVSFQDDNVLENTESDSDSESDSSNEEEELDVEIGEELLELV